MQESDFSTLGKIYVDVYEHFDVGERWDVESAVSLIRYWYERQPDLAFVAEIDSIIVGAFIAGVKPWWDGNHLVDGELFVSPAHQSSGVGTQLSITLYETALEKYKVVSFDTYTFKNTEFPLKWYESQGFEVNSEWVLIAGDVKQAVRYLTAKQDH
jgi:GNAT superfamily N-acetyltransferase